MGSRAEPKRLEESRRPKESAFHCHHVIDIASLEELFEHDGPLLAEDSELYHYGQAAQAGTEECNGVQRHVNRVMEQIKARKQDEVLQRFDSAMRTAAHRVDLLEANDSDKLVDTGTSEQLMRETIASLQAAQERMEIRARATAALQAAAQRAASASTSTTEKAVPSTKQNKSIAEPQVDQGRRASRAAPKAAVAKSIPKAMAPRPKEPDELQARIKKALEAAQSRQATEATATETLQDRIQKAMADAQRRTLQDAKSAYAPENEEQTTTASSYSATDSGSDDGADTWQPNLWWAPAPR